MNWTAPYGAGRTRPTSTGTGGMAGYGPSAIDVITMIHSARAWRRFHGPIDMYTDPVGLEWLARLGLTALYDRVDVSVLSDVDTEAFDPTVYRAIGKIVALGAVDEPVTLLDTDLYLEQPISGLGGDVFVFAHFETVGNDVYPSAEHLPDPNNMISTEWDFAQLATNTSIGYFGSAVHRAAFVGTALAYAEGNNGPTQVHPEARQVFAEQRIAPFEAMRLGIDMRPVFLTTWDPEARCWLGGPPHDAFHHTWRDKKRLAKDQVAARQYLLREMTKLTNRFPDERDRLLTLGDQGLFQGLLAAGEASELLSAARGV